MTVSKKQLQANKRNARKAKGPKNTSLTRLNALKHGILSREVLLDGEDGKTLEQLGKKLRSELQPTGELEGILVDRIISSVWRLKRCLRVERGVIEYEEADVDEYEYEYEDDDPLGYASILGGKKTVKNKWKRDPQVVERLRAIRITNEGERMERLLRYETALEKQVYKALHELIRLQGARKGEKPPAPLALDVDVSGGS